MAGGAIAKNSLSLIPATLVVALLSAMLVALAARMRCPEGRISDLGRLLGSASYSIYLFHPHAESAQLAILSKLFPGMPISLVVVQVVIVATVFGVAMHFAVEKPLVRIAKRWLVHRPLSPSTIEV
jgi:exopolysaccharide production protein ExoZ